MKLTEICNSNIILADNLKIIQDNNIDIKNRIIITFIGEENHKKNIFNFFNLVHHDFHYQYEKSSKIISEEFHDSLNISLALKKNLTRIFYGQIGLFPYYDVIKKLINNKNNLQIHTEDEKIFNISKNVSEHNDLKIFYKKKKILKKNAYFKISKLDLLRMYPLEIIIFYLKKKIFLTFKKFKNLKENVFVHLSTETNFLSIDRFLNKKWQSKILQLNLEDNYKLNQEEEKELFEIKKKTNLIIKNHFENNEYFKTAINKDINNFFKNYRSCFEKVSKIFKDLNSNFYFLTKIIRGPLATSLYDYGKKNSKKFYWISQQHGHGIELTEIHKKTQITKEETLADLLFVYSLVGKKEREENKFKKENIIIEDIGYHNNSYNLNKVPQHDIIYISNLNQELTGHEINMSALNNFEKIKFEEKLIKEVFAKINHKVLFKEYPGGKTSNIKNKYIKNLINPYKNITYFNQWLNAENIYNKSSVIITSLPTSGLAGAIKSQKPLVFIDIKKIMPLRDNLISIFKKKYLYINFDEDIFFNLKNYLSKDLKTIKSEWKKKQLIDKSNFEIDYINILSRKKVIEKIKNKITNFVKYKS